MHELLATLEAEGDVAAEKVWQSYAVVLLRHGQSLLQQLGMVQLLKMQQMCAEMVLKLRMAKRLAPDKGQDELMAEFDALMAQVLAPEEDTGDSPTPTHEGENEDEDATDAAC